MAVDVDIAEVLRFRQAKDRALARDPHSPIPTQLRPRFDGLDYYEPSPELAVRAPLEPVDGEPVVELDTSDRRTRRYQRVGRIRFEVDGEEAALTVLASEDSGSLFLPFRDATSGEETYGAGRYVDPLPQDDGTVVVDFNYAYNPFCAYSDAYSCPLPPPENWLRVPIRAGERAFGVSSG